MNMTGTAFSNGEWWQCPKCQEWVRSDAEHRCSIPFDDVVIQDLPIQIVTNENERLIDALNSLTDAINHAIDKLPDSNKPPF